MRNNQYNADGWGSFETMPWGKMQRILKSMGKRSWSPSSSKLWGKRGFSGGKEARLCPEREKRELLPWLDEVKETEKDGDETVTVELLANTLFPFLAPRGRRSMVGYGGWGNKCPLDQKGRSSRNKRALPPMNVMKEEDLVPDTVHDVKVTKIQKEPFTNGFSLSNPNYCFPNIAYRMDVSSIFYPMRFTADCRGSH